MINLYQILKLSPNASPATIQAALENAQSANAIDAKTAKAVQEWLLVPDVRQRYNAKLQSEFPEFFQAAEPVAKPKIAPLSEETADDDEYMDLPPLWNPKAAMWWSIFSNVAFGAIIHAKNWQALGEDDLAKQNWIWAGASIAVLFVIALIGLNVGLGIQIGLVIAWYQTLGKKQTEFFSNEFDNDYDKRSWWLAVFLLILGIIVFAVLATIVSTLLLSFG
ncbi:hypothetical protein [Kingella negevensis]|uniref:hypothetical protein n=1 Tax=Kingella negevensis TaxID=1522312 RepID=UPI00050A2B7B|nr:hypothetical protein [Kingella negevensis]MDK4683623.1 hypothetical protein [Kingella negevensis]MDK4687807.1 hypothetical protein [Kingella negevensis]MDK4697657.1 hypothetical protein [Kingella negevensis]WII91197.1 hypothetical protein QEO93_00965 [Kingella negevensis]